MSGGSWEVCVCVWSNEEHAAVCVCMFAPLCVCVSTWGYFLVTENISQQKHVETEENKDHDITQI